MKTIMSALCIAVVLTTALPHGLSQAREKLLMDSGWRFALGHSYDTQKDFNHGSGYFTYFAKAGYGDGAAAKNFDDRGWRILDLPHDWCVELPFDQRGGYSHGYRAMGRNFPENSVGWYRKKLFIPASDDGKRITVCFDGIFRNSIVWVNGFYCGTEHSGYLGSSYDVSEYLNYGGENVIAVRVDAASEEGWFYEGAGIYRHVWLTKTSPLHVSTDGTFVTAEVHANAAALTARTTIVNESAARAVFSIDESIEDETGAVIATHSNHNLELPAGDEREFRSQILIRDPRLWSIETPTMHRLATVIRVNGAIVDTYDTPFGIRTVRFDPNEGFFLNGRHVKILGTNIHQDHAGIGIAQPDAVQEFRIKQLKEMGSNAIRTSHNPPAPELLDACDRLGMLVLDENRLMGTTAEHRMNVERLMKRDRNHPSVILWSMGNEEWAIEGNITGARIGSAMQAFAQRFDSSRAFTAALSGGWEGGTGRVMEVMGYNYIVQGDIDGHHKQFPWQSAVGTEESNTGGTRGVYVTDDARAHMAPRNRMPENVGTESGWQFYASRPFLAGLFYWTGFDYRGEMHPYDWPAVSSQFGLLDACGFPKDISYYLRSWWRTDPVVHIVPDWDAHGRLGYESTVTVYSNCRQVELLLGTTSLGIKEMPVNGHLEWKTPYSPGTLIARGWTNGQLLSADTVAPAEAAAAIRLVPDRASIHADGEDVTVVTVQIADAHGRPARTDSSAISFAVEGPGTIIGVGNGDPSSHEPDKYYDRVRTTPIGDLKELAVTDLNDRKETADGFDDAGWKPALHSNRMDDWRAYTDSLLVIRGTFELPDRIRGIETRLFTKSILERQSIYVNGHLIAAGIVRDAPNQSFALDPGMLKPGRNVYAVTGQRFRKRYQWDEPNTDPGIVQIILPSSQWKRNAFNGLAQVLVQSTKQPGELILSATANGLKEAVLHVHTHPAAMKPAVSADIEKEQR